MSTQLLLTLNRGEAELLERETPDGASRQDYIRALLAMVKAGDVSRAGAQQAATDGRKISHPDDAPGTTKGLDADDYREAIEATGSLSGAAQELGVHRETVREMAALHEIEVPTLGGVPD